MHNAVPTGLGISMASAISSGDATSTHLLTTATFHVATHKCNGLWHWENYDVHHRRQEIQLKETQA